MLFVMLYVANLRWSFLATLDDGDYLAAATNTLAQLFQTSSLFYYLTGCLCSNSDFIIAVVVGVGSPPGVAVCNIA